MTMKEDMEKTDFLGQAEAVNDQTIFEDNLAAIRSETAYYQHIGLNSLIAQMMPRNYQTKFVEVNSGNNYLSAVTAAMFTFQDDISQRQLLIPVGIQASDQFGLLLCERGHDLLTERNSNDEAFNFLLQITNHNIASNAFSHKHKGDERHYTLTRGDSGMSQYSDLVDFILEDQVGIDDKVNEHERYEATYIKVPNPNRSIITEEIKKLDSENRILGKRIRSKSKNSVSLEKDERLQKENSNKRQKLKQERKNLPNNSEIDYKKAGLFGRLSLFRGENVNTKVFDLEKKESRERTKEEREEYATRKVAGKTLYADGTEPIKDDAKKLADTENPEYKGYGSDMTTINAEWLSKRGARAKSQKSNSPFLTREEELPDTTEVPTNPSPSPSRRSRVLPTEKVSRTFSRLSDSGSELDARSQ